jgi:D-glycero-D-manno-heptose 1,7-bisphosphate phosphatase
MKPRVAVFLDRDGTLNVDKGYVWRLEDWAWVPGSLDALRRLKAAGFALVVVTNQSGVARGMYGEEQVRLLHEAVGRQASDAGAPIDGFYYCPHLKDCDCRKPLPGLLTRAARDLGLDLPASWTVGDRLRDVEAGLAAGTRAILLTGGPDPEDARRLPPGALAAADLAEACDLIAAKGRP